MPLLFLPGSEKTIPLYLTRDDVLAFSPDRGHAASRVFLVSLPKAGTYLLATFLREMGWTDTEVHVGIHEITDYRGLTVDEKLAQARTRVAAMPFETSVSLVAPGQFAVGHIAFDPRREQLLKPFRRILIIRRWRDCLTSFMRFESRRISLDPLRHSADRTQWASLQDPRAKFVAYLKIFGETQTKVAMAIVPWKKRPGVVTVRFEDLTGDNGPAAQRASIGGIQEHIGDESGRPAEQLLARCIGAASLTFSGERSRAEDFWSPQACTLFQEFGGPALENGLGY